MTHDHYDLLLDSGAVRCDSTTRAASAACTTRAPTRGAIRCSRASPPSLSSPQFDADYLWRITRRRRAAIKQVLMNSRLVVGVGNIYASEALFRARIRPRRRAQSLSREEAARLARRCARCSPWRSRSAAPRCGITWAPMGEPGYFRQKLYVYERAGQACRVCGTLVRQLIQQGRSTYYCPSCQK